MGSGAHQHLVRLPSAVIASGLPPSFWRVLELSWNPHACGRHLLSCLLYLACRFLVFFFFLVLKAGSSYIDQVKVCLFFIETWSGCVDCPRTTTVTNMNVFHYTLLDLKKKKKINKTHLLWLPFWWPAPPPMRKWNHLAVEGCIFYFLLVVMLLQALWRLFCPAQPCETLWITGCGGSYSQSCTQDAEMEGSVQVRSGLVSSMSQACPRWRLVSCCLPPLLPLKVIVLETPAITSLGYSYRLPFDSRPLCQVKS